MGLIAFSVSAPIVWGEDLPAGNPDAPQRLANSPRHTEVIEVPTPSGATVKALLAHPQGSDPAPVVVVIHGRAGWTPWVQALADQLAAAGFIAIAPDMASGKGPGGTGTEGLESDPASKLVYSVTWDEVVERINAVADYAMALPAAEKRFAVVGFCWGGRTTFAYAGERPELAAGIVYYGGSPSAEVLARIKAPILGLYGGDDARVNVTIEPAALEMKRLGKIYQYEIYQGAGHAFLENQQRLEGANMTATQKAWPRTLQFLNEHLRAP
jgi:carboxymethylenebutenolidase